MRPTSSKFTGIPSDINCSLRTRDRFQSTGFNLGGGSTNWAYSSLLLSVYRICEGPSTWRMGSRVRCEVRAGSEREGKMAERRADSWSVRSGGGNGSSARDF